MLFRSKKSSSVELLEVVVVALVPLDDFLAIFVLFELEAELLLFVLPHAAKVTASSDVTITKPIFLIKNPPKLIFNTVIIKQFNLSAISFKPKEKSITYIIDYGFIEFAYFPVTEVAVTRNE